LNYSGPVPQVTYTISDVKGGLSSSTLNITITPVNDAPVATDDTGVVKANTPLTGNVILNDSDPEGSPITVTQFTVAGLVGTFTAGQTATIPNVGTLVINANGTFTFTPVLNYAGPVPVATYTISDGSATDTATLTLKINNPLVAVNDTGVVIQDTPLNGTVILNDSDADGDPIKVTQFTVDGLSETFTAGQTATIPLVGTLVINTDGSFTFTPFSNYTGPIPVVSYGISDGTDTAMAKLTLTINSVNYPPLASDDVDFVTEDTPLNGTLFDNDSDPDGNNTISISEFKVTGVAGTFTAGQTATIPNVGTLVINTDGSFTFTPVANYTGPIPVVTYTISDGTSTDTATLTLTITPVNDNPVAVADTKTTPEDTPVSGTVLANDTDEDGDPLAVTQFTVNGQTYLAGSTATINGVGTLKLNADGTYTFTPEKDFNGTVPVVTYEVSDGNGGKATATLQILVLSSDSDGDGVRNDQEIADGTNPNDPCDYKSASQVLSKLSKEWLLSDCDKDGLTNGEEINGIDNPSTPANPKGIKTDPRNPDSDGDGVSDGQESLDGTNPNDPCSFKLASQTIAPSSAWNNGDCDGDGVSNGKEKTDGTNPLNGCEFKVSSRNLSPSAAWNNGDCDNDGLKNEVDGVEDCDKDGTPNFLDPDTCKIDILIANVFTPNGDGINDEIKPVLLGIDKFVCFKVYNRWGNLVFETRDRDKGWDGDFRTQGQGTETFQWLAEGYDRNGKLVKRTGMITLLR
jgi:gliding motility-associated-like protein